MSRPTASFTVITGGNRRPVMAQKPQQPTPPTPLAKKIELLRVRKPLLAHMVEGMVDRLLERS